MIPYLRNLTAFQRLIINSLCLISHSVIYPVYFVLNQFRFFLKYYVFGMPHPEKKIETVQQPVEEEKEEFLEMPFNMERRRDALINELIASEKSYQDNLETCYEYYRPTLTSLVDKDTMKLFFGEDFSVLINTSVRIYVSSKEDSKFGAKDTIIGKTFEDAYENLMDIVPYVDRFLSALMKFNDLYYHDKNFKKKVQSLQRRTDISFKMLIQMPLERLIKYQAILNETFKNTPDWHEDFEFLKSITEKLRPITEKCQSEIEEGDRRLALLKLERKIRSCPPLLEQRRHFIGTWQLTAANMFIHVLSDRLLIVQQKTELLSRRKYFIVKKDVDLKTARKVEKDANGIRIITKTGDVIINIKLKVDELLDVIKERALITRHSEE
ncbi:hypothetical protein TRFO_13287 [Tritrichomonas foetus]|uniref:DH domain-containing protein n=1 Tax=Tritrichomonas foetus TaxID=1144522 RepID=A0A1J4KYE4_9EUKA|nr:hypothetical protein TRFO_13287 [Tritrichomonas foetus]|eukprot:OHT16281.1 hypothetical protein TRFO_13287 [Tritrichomonas foetus]